MPNTGAIMASVLAFVLLGIALPIAALVWLTAHHQAPYVLVDEYAESPTQAFPAHPMSTAPLTGVLDAVGDGSTATYAGGGSVSIVRHVESVDSAINQYTKDLDANSESGWGVGGYNQTDLTLKDDRTQRIIGTDDMLFVFTAPNKPAVDQLLAHTPSLRKNDRREIGNTILDQHAGLTFAILGGWFLVASLLATLAIMRLFRAI